MPGMHHVVGGLRKAHIVPPFQPFPGNPGKERPHPSSQVHLDIPMVWLCAALG